MVRTLEVMESPERVFLTSPFVHLEVRDLEKIEAMARAEATKAGLAAMGALHLAAAHLSRADEFITTEKPGRSIYRSPLIKVVYLFD